jgi:bacteriocin-like protein
MNNDRTLSETELDHISGGLRDKPDQDRLNKMIADENRGPGTVGASIYNNQFIEPDWKLPQTGGNPV